MEEEEEEDVRVNIQTVDQSVKADSLVKDSWQAMGFGEGNAEHWEVDLVDLPLRHADWK